MELIVAGSLFAAAICYITGGSRKSSEKEPQSPETDRGWGKFDDYLENNKNNWDDLFK